MATTVRMLVLLSLIVVAPTAAARGSAEEYEVKAAFLLRFVDYVDWPEGALLRDDEATHICVLGHDPFGGMLDALIRARPGERRPLQLHHVATAAGASTLCHVVYVGRTDRRSLRRDLARLREEPVLTVGDHSAFLDAGGVIAFRVEEDRIRLAINRAAAERAGLRISSRLLGIAQVVDAD